MDPKGLCAADAAAVPGAAHDGLPDIERVNSAKYDDADLSSRPSPPERLGDRGVGKIESRESLERAVWRPHLMSMAIPIASRGMLAAPGEHRVELLAEPARRHCYIDLMRETLLGLPFETVEAAGHGGSRLQIGDKRKSRRSRSPAVASERLGN